MLSLVFLFACFPFVLVTIITIIPFLFHSRLNNFTSLDILNTRRTISVEPFGHFDTSIGFDVRQASLL